MFCKRVLLPTSKSLDFLVSSHNMKYIMMSARVVRHVLKRKNDMQVKSYFYTTVVAPSLLWDKH